MRQIICEEQECYLEPAKVSQVGGSRANEITYMMSGEQDGLSPTEPSYMVPLPPSSRGQSTRKLHRKRKSVIQVGGSIKKRSGGGGGSKKKRKIGGTRGRSWRSKQLGRSASKRKQAKRIKKRRA